MKNILLFLLVLLSSNLIAQNKSGNTIIFGGGGCMQDILTLQNRLQECILQEQAIIYLLNRLVTFVIVQQVESCS